VRIVIEGAYEEEGVRAAIVICHLALAKSYSIRERVSAAGGAEALRAVVPCVGLPGSADLNHYNSEVIQALGCLAQVQMVQQQCIETLLGIMVGHAWAGNCDVQVAAEVLEALATAGANATRAAIASAPSCAKGLAAALSLRVPKITAPIERLLAALGIGMRPDFIGASGSRHLAWHLGAAVAVLMQMGRGQRIKKPRRMM